MALLILKLCWKAPLPVEVRTFQTQISTQMISVTHQIDWMKHLQMLKKQKMHLKGIL